MSRAIRVNVAAIGSGGSGDAAAVVQLDRRAGCDLDLTGVGDGGGRGDDAASVQRNSISDANDNAAGFAAARVRTADGSIRIEGEPAQFQLHRTARARAE